MTDNLLPEKVAPKNWPLTFDKNLDKEGRHEQRPRPYKSLRVGFKAVV